MSELTRDQVKAMRAADTAVLRFTTTEPDANVLELVKEVERPDGFGRETLRVQIPARAIVQNYGGGACGIAADRPLAAAIQGDWVLLSLSVRPEWQTLAHFVRAGDTLEQEWVIDNRSESLAQAHVTMHEIKLRVLRPVGNDPNPRVRVFSFLLDAHAEPDSGYSSAIRRGAA